MGKKRSNVTPAVLRGKKTTFFFSKFLLQLINRSVTKGWGQRISHSNMYHEYAVILFQTIVVSTGTHLGKNRESRSRTNESQLKKTTSLKLKMLGTLFNQTVDLKTDSETLYYSALK